MNLSQNVREAVDYINSDMKLKPKIGIILGSGLGKIADEIEDAKVYKYSEIPYFPVSTVQGHKNCLVIGKLQGKTVVAMQGRFHYYEGFSMKEVVFPIMVMKMMGVEILIVTNASGGINKKYSSGDLMLIKDHINLSGQNPLIGQNSDKFGPRFPDMSEAYDRELREIAKKTALKLGIFLQEGVYAYMTGPSYETPAEINMLGILGGDAVGMSTVPEVIAANYSGIKVLGLSCITNMAAGILDHRLSHEEVIKASAAVSEKFIDFTKEIVKRL
ncbi:purine-nucleoside phosphorylase [Clostridium luticellarii]|jgi:purine-nucleoside phosphorylase|uniref:Purine nucleoside phosphorylase n=1 Tax=Clostridium luticellarii TaxID=1691940 RepID=A0A2T0BPL2_9CLOT|nr:purine-nucleoside phosphorylase [Clostridium luticellarii]MCI1944197.1 purine-nucleoside phosphorylase [Clostridium luticellarii]MCI1967699.1 purine-nucleoside phosphorylase [Clostridium luticellarii]MCI1994852.1 purine-nucleoside phosphorylase [Clostridium luticellarii]MCI2039663.1 purine-nucleoside phosphorylase [Clostridium luticellarii]PRR85810.1 Purine nucleoside phosphorylase 1 [Clostridium luticellarii]